MESQKIVNLSNDTSNDKFSTKNGMSLMIKITRNIVKEIKMIQALYLRQKLSDYVFVIIQMHIFL